MRSSHPKEIHASPKDSTSTHDIVLTAPDGKKVGLVLAGPEGQHNPLGIARTPVNRTAMKTYEGQTSWGSFRFPWSPIAKTSWVNGRGQRDHNIDSSKYADGFRADTSNGYIVLGPQETYTTGLHTMALDLPGSVTWKEMLSSNDDPYIARKISFTGDAVGIAMHLRRIGTPQNDLTIEIVNDNAGVPGSTVSGSVTVDTDDITDLVSVFLHKDFTSALSLSGDYWIKVYIGSGHTDTDHWEIATYAASGSDNKISSNGTTWTNADFTFYYKLYDAGDSRSIRLFSYKRAIYALAEKDGSAPELYILGDRGVADVPTVSNTLNDSSKSWVTDEFVGAICVIIEGKGYDEEKPFRKIVSNTANQLILETDWNITHDNTTNYVIIGANTWHKITGHGMTGKVTSIIQSKGVMYFCQGDAIAIRRMRWYNNSGTATYDWADDGTNKAYAMALVRQTNGLKIWRGQNSDASGDRSLSVCDPVGWGSNLNFGTTTYPLEDYQYGRIVSLLEYEDDGIKMLHVMREGMINTVDKDGVIDKIQLEELATGMYYKNGEVAIKHNVYLVFSLGASIERFYGNEIKDIGPNLDDGLPEDRQGMISFMVSMPGYYFVGVNAGESGYSSVFKYNQLGYHELYRSPAEGQQVTSAIYEAVDDGTNRLLIAVGDDVVWLPMESLTANPLRNPDMRYVHEAVIENGYMVAGMYDTWKLWYALKVVTEQMPEGTWITCEWRKDEETAWTRISEEFTETPVQTLPISAYGQNAKKFQIRVRLHTSDNTETPKVIAMILDAITRVDVRYSFAFNYRVDGTSVNLQGEENSFEAYDDQDLLDYWARTITPLHMDCRQGEYHNKVVFIDPTPSKPTAENWEAYTHQMTLIQIEMESMDA